MDLSCSPGQVATWRRRDADGIEPLTLQLPGFSVTERGYLPNQRVSTDPAIRRDVARFARGVSNRVTLEVAEALRRFNRPVLLLWGDADRFFPLSLAERLRAMIPNARLQVVRGGGLFLSLDCPDAVADGIAAFIRGAG